MRSLVVLSTTCGLASAALAGPSVPAAKSAPKDAALRATDWCNWSYANNDIYPMLIACKATVDERHSEHGGIWATLEFRFVSATYGDLTGDGAEDALLALSVTQRPVVRSAGAPTIRAEFWLMQRRPDGMYIYTSESADAVPTNVSIRKGIATLQWRIHGKTCEERWAFRREGETADKSARTCKP